MVAVADAAVAVALEIAATALGARAVAFGGVSAAAGTAGAAAGAAGLGFFLKKLNMECRQSRRRKKRPPTSQGRCRSVRARRIGSLYSWAQAL
jgi:hypothetical protein